ncbi:MAG TPA: zinc-binding dehydrogenase, partial [Sphingomicrobium sp.]
LKPRGLMVRFGNASGAPEPMSPLVLAQKGSLYLTRPTLFNYVERRSQLEQSATELFAMVAQRKVKIEVKQRFALEDAAEAHRALEARQTTGSTVFTI